MTKHRSSGRSHKLAEMVVVAVTRRHRRSQQLMAVRDTNKFTGKRAASFKVTHIIMAI